MPRYFLNLHGDAEVVLDPEGADYASEDLMRAAALSAAREIISQDALLGTVDLRYRIEAVNEAGQVLHELSFADAVAFAFGADVDVLAA